MRTPSKILRSALRTRPHRMRFQGSTLILLLYRRLLLRHSNHLVSLLKEFQTLGRNHPPQLHCRATLLHRRSNHRKTRSLAHHPLHLASLRYSSRRHSNHRRTRHRTLLRPPLLVLRLQALPHCTLSLIQFDRHTVRQGFSFLPTHCFLFQGRQRK